MSFGSNETILALLRHNIEGLSSDSKIILDSYSSPEGRSSWNKVLALRRAESVKRKLVSLGVPEDRIVVRELGENWKGLREQVGIMHPGTDKDSILRILDDESIASDDLREQALMNLRGGAAWNSLIAGGAMDPIRCVEITISPLGQN